jgi:hypothetical protein
MGENVTGFAYFLTPLWIISAGYQTPLFNSSSQKALVVELTYSLKTSNLKVFIYHYIIGI